MKKKFLLAVLCTGLASASFATKVISISKNNPGAEGYKSVTESHDTENDLHTLNCWSPGIVECQWLTSPWNNQRMNDIDQYVKSQLDNGIFSGRFDAGDANVSWSAENTTDYTITIDVKG